MLFRSSYPLPSANAGVSAVAVGPDGALWFLQPSVGKIGRITTAGEISEFPLVGVSTADSLIAVPIGEIWVGVAFRYIGARINMAGATLPAPNDIFVANCRTYGLVVDSPNSVVAAANCTRL